MAAVLMAAVLMAAVLMAAVLMAAVLMAAVLMAAVLMAAVLMAAVLMAAVFMVRRKSCCSNLYRRREGLHSLVIWSGYRSWIGRERDEREGSGIPFWSSDRFSVYCPMRDSDSLLSLSLSLLFSLLFSLSHVSWRSMQQRRESKRTVAVLQSHNMSSLYLRAGKREREREIYAPSHLSLSQISLLVALYCRHKLWLFCYLSDDILLFCRSR